MEIWLFRVTVEAMLALGATCWAAYRAEKLLDKLARFIIRASREGGHHED